MIALSLFGFAWIVTFGFGPVPDKTAVPTPPKTMTPTLTCTPTDSPTGTLTPAPSQAPTLTPVASPEPDLPVYLEPTETYTPVTPIPTLDLAAQGICPELPELTVFPNPAREKNLNFRFRSPETWKVVVKIYDAYGEEAGRLEREGKDTFDLAWPLGLIESGIYYYRVTAEHLASGRILKYPVGRFVVDRIAPRKPKAKGP